MTSHLQCQSHINNKTSKDESSQSLNLNKDTQLQSPHWCTIGQKQHSEPIEIIESWETLNEAITMITEIYWHLPLEITNSQIYSTQFRDLEQNIIELKRTFSWPATSTNSLNALDNILENIVEMRWQLPCKIAQITQLRDLEKKMVQLRLELQFTQEKFDTQYFIQTMDTQCPTQNIDPIWNKKEPKKGNNIINANHKYQLTQQKHNRSTNPLM